jgi:hypothetical protein
MSETPTETPRRRPLKHIRTITDLVHTADVLGSYFFSLDTMRWFSSRLSGEIRVFESETQHDGGPERIVVLFITSERNVRSAWDEGRRYTVRKATILPHKGTLADRGDFIFFDTIGEFGQYETLAQAKKALRRVTGWEN